MQDELPLPLQAPPEEDLYSRSESRCWEPWGPQGPQLRSDSFTAKQLRFLTERAIYLESRSEFIGDFPAGWVEANCAPWNQAVIDSTLAARDSALDTERPTKRNINRQRRLVDIELANQIANATTDNIKLRSSKNERLRLEMQRRRRRFVQDQLSHHHVDSLWQDWDDEDVEDEEDAEDGDDDGAEDDYETDKEDYGEEQRDEDDDADVENDAQDSLSDSRTIGELLDDFHSETDLDIASSAVAGPAESVQDSAQDAAPSSVIGSMPAAEKLADKTAAYTAPAGAAPSIASSSTQFFDAVSYLGSEPETSSTRSTLNTSPDSVPELIVTPPEEDASPQVIETFKQPAHSSSHASKDVPKEELHSEPPSRMVMRTDTHVSSTPSKLKRPKIPRSPSSRSSQLLRVSTRASEASDASTTLGMRLKRLSTRASRVSHVSRASHTSHSSLGGRGRRILSRSKVVRMLTHHSEGDSDEAGDPVDPIDRLAYSVKSTNHNPHWHHVPFVRSSEHGPKVYQGQFLVQERRSRLVSPDVNETSSPLSTQLVTRWKECSILAKRTNSIKQPLTLYFYRRNDSKNVKSVPKMSLFSDGPNESDKAHGLLYKIRLSQNYKMAFFSPLDMTIAIWRPRRVRRGRRYRIPGTHLMSSSHTTRKRGSGLQATATLTPKSKSSFLSTAVGTAEETAKRQLQIAGKDKPLRTKLRRKHEDHPRARDYFHKKGARHGNNTPSYTQVIVIHAQSMTTIMDLAFLLAAGTSFAPVLHGRANFDVLVPSINVAVKVDAFRTAEHDPEALKRALEPGLDQLVAVRELRKPAVSVSSASEKLVRSIWQLIEELPRRFNISRTWESAETKFALAWVMDDVRHRILWLPSASATMYPLNRLNFLLNGKSTLAMAPAEPRCFLADSVEPTPVEGFCLSSDVISSVQLDRRIYVFTSDNYLMFMAANDAEPPMLAAAQNTVVKKVEPFPLDENNEILWIRRSTCLGELDFHNARARLELARKAKNVEKSRALIDLVYFETVTARGNTVELAGTDHPSRYHIALPTPELAELWAEKLRAVARFWRMRARSATIRHIAGVEYGEFPVSSFLRNRAIVFSGQLFMKQHRFATFKPYHVLLTSRQLIVFRIAHTLRSRPSPGQSLPSMSVNHKHILSIDIEGTYVYSGVMASHVLLNNDSHIDASRPGVLALPRSYDLGWTSTDTELERCFVLWIPRKLRSVFSSNTGDFYAFLAPHNIARDAWVTSVRYVQTHIAGNAVDDLEFDREVGDDESLISRE